MRPRTGESKEVFAKRIALEYPSYPEDTRIMFQDMMWSKGPIAVTDIDIAREACCGLTKEEIPAVQASIFLAEPVLAAIWEQMLDKAAEEVASAQQDDLGPEWILFLINEMWRGLWTAPRPEQTEILRHAAYNLGAYDRKHTAASELLLQARGKFHLHATEISNLIARRLPKQMIRDGMAAIFGPSRPWIVPVVDMWAHRWHWVGTALNLRGSKVQTFRYWNPLTETTSRFCRWLVNSGRTVTLGRILSQVKMIERAVIENNIETVIQSWPMIALRGGETDADFNKLYVQHDLACPPFHWRCRTHLIPLDGRR